MAHLFDVFCITLEHCDFAKTSKKHRFLHCFVKAELLRIKERSMKFDQKKCSKIISKNTFGMVLASIWERFGTLWGVLWLLLDAFWPSSGLAVRDLEALGRHSVNFRSS